MKKILIYLKFVFLCTIITSSVISCTKDDEKSDPVPEKVVFNPTSLNMIIGDSKAIIATIEPALSDPIKSVITWSSTDDKIVNVLNGMVSAVSVGEATIKAVTANGIECLCNVKVDAKPIFAIGLNIVNEGVVIETGKTLELDYEIIPFDANINRDILWQSSDEKVATVKDGVVTAVSKGSVVVKGSFKNGISTKINVVINPSTYVIDPNMVGTFKCVKLQVRYLRTGKIYEEEDLDKLFRFSKDYTKEIWCKEMKEDFRVKSTSSNAIISSNDFGDDKITDILGEIVRNEDIENKFYVNYDVIDFLTYLSSRYQNYHTLELTWLPKEKQVLYDEPTGSFFDVIYTCNIVKEEAKSIKPVFTSRKLRSLECIE